MNSNNSITSNKNPNAKENGIPLLAIAISENDLEAASELIKNGADVNSYATKPAAERGMAAIHFASSPEAVELLAKAGADINAPYKEVDHAWGMRGETALHTAALGKKEVDLALSEALIKAGADSSIPYNKEEFKYSKNSNLSINDEIVRKGITINSKLTELRNDVEANQQSNRRMRP